MAKTNNPLFNQTGGKIGSLVISRNGVIRERVYRNPSQSEAQMRQRAVLAGLSRSWAQLSDVQRGTWGRLEGRMNAASAAAPSGYMTYMQVNGTLAACGQPTVPSAPANPQPAGTLPPLYLEAIHSTSGLPLILNIRSAAFADMVQVYAIAPASAGRSAFGISEFKLVTTLLALSSGSTNIGDEYSALFGEPTGGQKIAVRLFPISAQGFRGDPIEAVATVTTIGAVQTAPIEAALALKAA